jgi:hypothetical protein
MLMRKRPTADPGERRARKKLREHIMPAEVPAWTRDEV